MSVGELPAFNPQNIPLRIGAIGYVDRVAHALGIRFSPSAPPPISDYRTVQHERNDEKRQEASRSVRNLVDFVFEIL